MHVFILIISCSWQEVYVHTVRDVAGVWVHKRGKSADDVVRCPAVNWIRPLVFSQLEQTAIDKLPCTKNRHVSIMYCK